MKRKAFNLVEVMIAVALLGIVSLGLVVLLKLPIDVNIYSEKEYNVQSDLRISSETVNGVVRDATAAFLLTKNDNKFTKGWNYFICEEEDGKSKIVVYEWKDTAHVKRVLAEIPAKEVEFSVEFEKSSDGNLLKYNLLAKDISRNKDYKIETELKPLNAFNITDESTVNKSLNPPRKVANCLAYRTDRPKPDKEDEGYHHVSVSFVLDTSGSMEKNLANGDPSSNSDSRIYKLKQQLISFFATMKAQDKGGIVDVRLYPFSFYMAYNTATEGNINMDSGTLRTMGTAKNDNRFFQYGEKYGSFQNIKSTDLSILNNMVDSLTPGGATNVGDGIRHAYHGIKEYEEKIRKQPGGKNKRIKHYLFVLTDGVPTYCTLTTAPVAYNISGDTSEIYDPATIRVFSRKRYHDIGGTPYFSAHFLYGFKKGTDGSSVYLHSGYTNDELVYSGNGTNVDKGKYLNRQLKDNTGSGSFDSPGYEAEIKYVDQMSGFVKKYRSKNPKEPVDVTVVGFSSRNEDNAYCDRIGEALGAPKGLDGKHYKASTSDKAVQAIFKSFTESVVSSTLWYVAGPQ